MATGPRYSVKFRRRREGKTSYRKRRAMLVSRIPRLVIRKTNNYLIGQIILYSVQGDKVLASANSSELSALGWKHDTKNLPAAYLTGMLIAKKAIKAKVAEAIPDLGIYNITKGSKLFAFLKGAIDGGLKVKTDEKNLPSADRLKGKHISEEVVKDFEAVKVKIK